MTPDTLAQIVPALTAVADNQTELLRRQSTLEVVLHRMLGIMEIHGQKLDLILEAATAETCPSETTKLLQRIVDALEEQTETLSSLPVVLGDVIRREFEDPTKGQQAVEEVGLS